MRTTDLNSTESYPSQPIYLDEVAAEKSLKAKLKALDPAPREFDESYLDSLEAQIMEKVMKTKMEPKPKPGPLTRYLTIKKFRMTKSVPPLMAIFALLFTISQTQTSSQDLATELKSDSLLSAALESPQNFQVLVDQLAGESTAGGLDAGHFFVDVALQNFDHLTLNELDELLSRKSASNSQ